MKKISIQVPATTANLGPGFDCVGVALNLRNELQAQWSKVRETQSAEEPAVTVEGEGAKELSGTGMCLFFQALQDMLELSGQSLAVQDLSLNFKNGIPLQSGLGSSAACILSALLLGQEILATEGIIVSEEQLLKLAIKLEGHPDNVVPAYYGGAYLNVVRDPGLPLSLPLEIPEELDFLIVHPDLKIKTEKSRKALPEKFSLEDAVKNTALLGGLILSFQSRDYSHLPMLIDSPLHLPYRSTLIPGYELLKEKALQAGALGFTISGAGPSLLVLTCGNSAAIGAALLACFEKQQISARYFISKVDYSGASLVCRGRTSDQFDEYRNVLGTDLGSIWRIS